MAQLEILFYGLIALVPSNSANPSHINVYLLDQRQETRSSDLCRIHRHYPFLAFEVESRKDCGCPPPQFLSGEQAFVDREKLCWCDLSRHEIIFEPGMIKQVADLKHKPPSDKPRRDEEADDFSWVLRMSNVVEQGNSKDWPEISSRVVARMDLSSSYLKSCNLADLDREGEDEEIYETYPFLFRPLVSPGPVSLHRQAVAESFMARAEFDQRDVALKLRSLDAPDRVEDISVGYICRNGTCADLLVGNTPLSLHSAHNCGGGDVGRDFELYYNLMERPPQIGRRPVPYPYGEPRRSVGSTCPIRAIIPCQLIRGEKAEERCVDLVSGRAICPMVIMSN